MNQLDDLNFPGTQRFAIIRRLGAGGMGVVYEAIDRERNGRVALKTFRPISRDAVLRLKDEFRALQGVYHRNLVRLDELFEDGGNWFFTMELVDGVDILSHVGQASSSIGVSATVERDATADLYGEPPPRVQLAQPNPFARLDEGKLRDALPQLVVGLDALHAAGKVHRDIKPPNVLVTRDNRVVILDFGLVHDVPRDDEARPSAIVGTVAYMAPEQAAGDAVGTAADWYAVGVLLYEALTGQLPFRGHAMYVLTEKQHSEPVSPRTIVPDAPPDLSALCMELLRPNPSDRPPCSDILDRLSVRRRATSVPRMVVERLFVGREAELAALGDALAEVASGKTVVATVRGESGVGKSQLVRHFIETAVGDAIVLAGRCYERESVPYKAFDGIIDELTRFLGRLPPDELDELLPERVASAAQVFPVLRGIDAIAHAARPDEALDPQQQRTRLFAAVRELFTALAARYRLILVVDDLQWTDAESIALLRELLRPPNAPPIVYLTTLRATEAGAVAIADIEKTVALAARVHDIPLGALSSSAAEELVAKLVDRMGGSPAQAGAIAREAHGHPLFIQELVLAGRTTPGAIQLDDAIMGRVARLAIEQRRLIELVAIAGRPLPQATIARAANVDFAEFAAHADELRAANLIKQGGARRADAVEPYHDRVREAVLARLTAQDRTAIHQQLAIALEAAQHPDPETLAIHWRDAGKPERAVGYALAAAEQATAAVAFGRAARLYRMALDLGIADPDERRRVAVQYADALAIDGQSTAAAQAYLAAAEDIPTDRRLLTQRAAEQLLRAGHINEGLAHVRTVLADMGMRLPKSPRAALVSLLYQRAAVRLRGLRYTLRDEADLDPEQLERIDACWAVALLGFVDTLRGADFGTRHLRLALAAGEPRRLARAVAVEAVYASNIGHGYQPRAHALIAEAQKLAETSGSAYANAFVVGANAVVEHALGNFHKAREMAERAERIFRSSCTGVAWELDLVQLIALMCLSYEGNTAELARRIPPILAEAHERGDLFCVSSVGVIIKYRTHLLVDQPDEARRVATDAMANWGQDGFQLQHRHALLAHAEIDTYLGDGKAAHERFEASWRALKKSLLLEAQQQRLELFDARGRAAIAAGLLPDAERYAAKIDRDRMAWATPLAQMIRAGVARRRGETERAIGLVRDAVTGFTTSGMTLHAAIARRILGEHVGGTEGASLVAAADRWLADANVKSVTRTTALLAPGFAEIPVRPATA